MTKSRKNLKSSTGAVLAEFVVTVPLVILFIAGITEVGRVIGQMGHVSQMAYHGAMAGGNSVSTLRETVALDQVNNIYTIVSPKFHFDAANPISATSVDDPTSPYLTVTVPGILPTTISDWDLSFSSTITGPILIKDSIAISNIFENPATAMGDLYDCTGAQTGALDTPCNCGVYGTCSS